MNQITGRSTPDFAKNTVYRFMKMIQINRISFTTILSVIEFSRCIAKINVRSLSYK